MDEESPSLEPILTARQRRTPITLPIDPTEEELARDWTLSDADKAEVLRCRGDGHRRSFAVQLCVLRRYGRFLIEYEAIPVPDHQPSRSSARPPSRPVPRAAPPRGHRPGT